MTTSTPRRSTSSPESDNEEASESDNEEQETPLPPSPPTIYNRHIFGTVDSNDKIIKDAVEDRLFGLETTPTHVELLKEAMQNPLNSYLASMSVTNYRTNVQYIEDQQKSMENVKTNDKRNIKLLP